MQQKFRKKPVEIEAVAIADLIRAAQANWADLPLWVSRAYEAGGVLFADDHVIVQTLEGPMRGDQDDWLIQGVKGELYPCKPDIFEATYEPA